MSTSKIQHVLVKLPNYSGDLMMVLPTLRYIQALVPLREAQFHFIVHEEIADLFAITGIKFAQILREKKRVKRGLLRLGRVRYLRTLIAENNVPRCDLGLVITRQGDYAVLFRELGIPLRVGWNTAFMRWAGINSPVNQPSHHDIGHANQVGAFRRIAFAVANFLEATAPVERLDITPRLRIPEETEAALTRSCLEKLPAHDRDKLAGDYYVIVSGSSAGPTGLVKRWPLRFFVETARLVGEWQPRWTPVFSFGIEERDLQQELLRNEQSSAIVSRSLILDSRRTTWAEYVALLKRSKFVLTNDTGPRHVALAVRTKTISIFGPTPLRRAIYSPDSERPIKMSDDCRHSCNPQKGECQFRLGSHDVPACLLAVTPKFVMRQIQQFLEYENADV